MRLNLDRELDGLDPKLRDFVRRMCGAYVRGLDPKQREAYKDRRRTMRKLAAKLRKIESDCRELARNLDGVSDDVREAHVVLPSKTGQHT